MQRGLDHLDRLGRLLDLEKQAQHERFETRRAGLTLAQREAEGLAILDLEAVDDAWGLGGRALIELEKVPTQRLEIGLTSGDVVEVRQRREGAGVPLRALVARRSATRIRIALDGEAPEWLLSGRVVLEKLPDDVTHARARQALDRVRAMDRGAAGRMRSVLLGIEPPRFERPVSVDSPLNPEQADAAARALAAEDFFLVHGPPGTGKSTVLAEVAMRAVARGEKLLATAASNAAVDHLMELLSARGLRCVRIGHPARIAEHLQGLALDSLVEEHESRRISRDLYDEAHELLGHARRQRTQGRSRARFATAREAQGEARRLLAEARELEKRAVKAVLERAQVIGATLTGAASPLLDSVSFDLALHDEATQAVEPLSLWAFLRAPRVVLAGDHKQLPPTVISPQAAAGGLSVSLFERLLEDHGPGSQAMLREQHRMNEALMAFPSAQTYGGELRAHPSVASIALSDLVPGLEVPRFLFVDTAGRGFFEEREQAGESRRNPGEAGIVAAHVRKLFSAGLPLASIGVITPYAAQATLLRELCEGAEVDTVDAFQGREKEAVVVSLVRSNDDGELGFLQDLRRINVAITRARRHLCIVGDSATLGRHPYYEALISRAQEVGGWMSAWELPD